MDEVLTPPVVPTPRRSARLADRENTPVLHMYPAYVMYLIYTHAYIYAMHPVVMSLRPHLIRGGLPVSFRRTKTSHRILQSTSLQLELVISTIMKDKVRMKMMLSYLVGRPYVNVFS